MKKTCNIIIITITALFHCHISFAFSGPLHYKNQFPLFLHTNAPTIESAKLSNRGLSISLSYSSINEIRYSENWSLGLDMEISTLTIMYNKTINDLIELSLGIPIHSFHSGFMDDFINSYHNTFDFPDYGRSKRPTNEFLYEVKRNGKILIKGKNGKIDVGDVRFSAKTELFSNDPAISIRGDLELPTGEAKSGFGNESIDGALTLLIDKDLGQYFKLYSNTGVVFPGNLNAYEKLDLKTYFFGAAAIEYTLSKSLTIPINLYIQSSPYPHTGIRQIDNASIQLAVGGRYSFNNSHLELSFAEDINTSGAPDFSINLIFFK